MTIATVCRSMTHLNALTRTSTVNKEFNRVKKMFVKAKLGHACLVASSMLCDNIKAHGIACEMRRGFLVIDYMQAAYWHAWVDVDGTSYDIGTAIMKELKPDILHCGKYVSHILPHGCIKMDIDELLVSELNMLYELYMKSTEEFWAIAPLNITTLRQQLNAAM